jgi:hypothetical protein
METAENCEDGCVEEKENEVNQSTKKRWTDTERRRNEKRNSIPSMFSDDIKEALSTDEAARHYFIEQRVFVERTSCSWDLCIGDVVQRRVLGDIAGSEPRQREYFRCVECSGYSRFKFILLPFFLVKMIEFLRIWV